MFSAVPAAAPAGGDDVALTCGEMMGVAGHMRRGSGSADESAPFSAAFALPTSASRGEQWRSVHPLRGHKPKRAKNSQRRCSGTEAKKQRCSLQSSQPPAGPSGHSVVLKSAARFSAALRIRCWLSSDVGIGGGGTAWRAAGSLRMKSCFASLALTPLPLCTSGHALEQLQQDDDC